MSAETSTKPLTKESVLSKYTKLFNGIGRHEGEVSIIDPTIIPVVHLPRRVPVSLHDKVTKELHRMKNAGIIAKVDTPSCWVNSIVAVSKTGTDKVRICLDQKDLI